MLLAQRRQAQLADVPPALLDLARAGPAPLVSDRITVDAPLRIATVIPSFRRGSGGHATIVNLLQELTRRGHFVSIWLDDYELRHAGEPESLTRQSFSEFFRCTELELHINFDDWTGADVVMATGWQTVPRVLLLRDANARAYLVQDHEPDFYAASAQRLFAEATYRQGLYCIAASEWLAELLRSRYDAAAAHFDLAVDDALYRPAVARRRDDLLVFYARAVTPRRAVPLGLLALAELARRRPDVEIALFGEAQTLHAPFQHTNLGVLDASALAQLYSSATVGMVFSLTNPSLIGFEMMACGLPSVDLATPSTLATFGTCGPLELVEADPLLLCSALEQLLDDPILRERLAAAGTAWMAGRTWSKAAEQVEQGLLTALSWRG